MNKFPKNKTKLIPLTIFFFFSTFLLSCFNIEAKCKKGCDVAIASYYIWQGSNLTYIANIFEQNLPNILQYNPQVPGTDSIRAGTRINLPFSCECINGDFLGHTFSYVTQKDDTYSDIAKFAFANLTTDYWIQRVNVYDPTQVPDSVPINVTVNCSCGDHRVSREYGLFATYPLRPEETLGSVAADTGVSADLLKRFNPSSNFDAGSGIVFLPAKGRREY